MPTAEQGGYLIHYRDHRHDLQQVVCSSWEDAERLAQTLAEWYGEAVLLDSVHNHPQMPGRRYWRGATGVWEMYGEQITHKNRPEWLPKDAVDSATGG